MADIGPTLRDTRIRKKIDIGSVESATKIRAKYLRALENEEWAVLPGPTYVKSFVRTYAEFLGLDPFVLIEEFNARFEEPEELEVQAFTREAGRRQEPRRFRRPSRATVIVVLVVAFLGFLIILGLQQEDKSSGEQGAAPITPPQQSVTKTPREIAVTRDARKRRVRLVVVPSREVWVCLVDSAGKVRVDGKVLAEGDNQGPFRSKSFKVTVGNGGGDLRINGTRKNVPETSEPIGYSITPKRVRLLSDAARPACEG